MADKFTVQITLSIQHQQEVLDQEMGKVHSDATPC